MSLVPGDDGHFARWLESRGLPDDDPDALTAGGALYVRRSVFADYVWSHVRPLVADGRIDFVRDAVATVAATADGWSVTGAGGGTLASDAVVLATTHPPPAPPVPVDDALKGHPRFIGDTTDPAALDAVRHGDRVLLVGTGLTGADIVASLTARGHAGPILALSRRGLLPRGHAPGPVDPFGDFAATPSRSSTDLLRRVRRTIAEAKASGLDWHPVLDQLRLQGGVVWQHLGVSERRRLVRHLRPYWDVHRFRIAPQVQEVLRQARESGRLEVLAGRVDRLEVGAAQVFEATLRPRGGQGLRSEAFDAVVIATGPAHGSVLANQPHLAALAAAGRLVPDPTGLGLACDRFGRALDASGEPDPRLLVAGPLARGTFGELMGLPQVSDYAAFIADRIVRTLIGEDR